MDEREVLTWGGFGEACRGLAQQVRESGFEPTVIIAVARGGLLPAGALAYALDVDLADAINVERYADPSEPVADPVLLAPLLDSESIAGRQLLVVDDVTDSGRTLGLVTKLLRGFGADVRSAVLYSKPNTIFTADFVWKQTQDWVVFPWGADNG
ncbi:phosphoribosyltransferase [Tessaracoccus rhinocerotis]|uniref:Phosphoribosyltransferase n=1 Tax=Tessaracoccus rhinocerotis TaxID=1689449 RepID=A0A553K231_9ACTN|nr:phosphoribosyltransferase [Tessaracoccus rhinocerotis]TRY18749.1 phosphoribosyltransferase [Tessaracoccus rhinocerotis]